MQCFGYFLVVSWLFCFLCLTLCVRLTCSYTMDELTVNLNCYTLEISAFSNTQLAIFQKEIKSELIDAGTYKKC